MNWKVFPFLILSFAFLTLIFINCRPNPDQRPIQDVSVYINGRQYIREEYCVSYSIKDTKLGYFDYEDRVEITLESYSGRKNTVITSEPYVIRIVKRP